MDLVEELKAKGIVDKGVLKAMGQIPREEFVPRRWRQQAYDDSPLPIGFGQTISQPYIVALMCQLLALTGKEKVLDIGTGSGYQAAVLSKLAKEVITIERIPQLAKKAKKTLQKLGFNNIKVIVGDGYRGYAKQAPYEAIKAAANLEKVPPSWREQLKVGGRMVFPLNQELVKMTKTKNRWLTKNYGGVAFVPLVSR